MNKCQTYSVKDRVYPLRKIVNNKEVLTDEEVRFINRNSHIDFPIFNKFDKRHILVIEIDGGILFS